MLASFLEQFRQIGFFCIKCVLNAVKAPPRNQRKLPQHLYFRDKNN
nr:hypothetical protein [uncultured Campylobacter sp.]